MTRERMTAMLSETLCVNAEEARTALEASAWKVMEAAQLLQRQSARTRKAEAAEARRASEWTPLGAIRAWIARFGRRDEARRDDSAVQAVSAAALAPLMLMPAVYACR